MLGDLFYLFRDLLKNKTGIYIRDHEKWTLLQSELGEKFLRDLISKEEKGISSKNEWMYIYKVLNISETYFYRDPDQLEAIFRRIVPGIASDSPTVLKIWSAGCSKGEEVYTLAILCKLMFGGYTNFTDFFVWGTDIQESSIEFAKNAKYSKYSVRNSLPLGFERYLIPTEEGISVSEDIRKKVEFSVGNLFSSQTNLFHLIVCRNVLIYFDEEKREDLVQRLSESLYPGGILVLGHSEFLGEIPGLVSESVENLHYFRKKKSFETEVQPSQGQMYPFLEPKGVDPKFSASKVENKPSKGEERGERNRVSSSNSNKSLRPFPKEGEEKGQQIKDLEHKLYETPSDIGAYYDLSQIYWEMGNRRKARMYQAQAWSFFKNDPSFSETLKERGEWKDEWEEYLIHLL